MDNVLDILNMWIKYNNNSGLGTRGQHLTGLLGQFLDRGSLLYSSGSLRRGRYRNKYRRRRLFCWHFIGSTYKKTVPFIDLLIYFSQRNRSKTSKKSSNEKSITKKWRKCMYAFFNFYCKRIKDLLKLFRQFCNQGEILLFYKYVYWDFEENLVKK